MTMMVTDKVREAEWVLKSFVTVEEAADRLRLSPQMVRVLTDSGKLASVRIPHKQVRLLLASDVDRLAAERRRRKK